MEEQGTHKPLVVGSNPTLAIISCMPQVGESIEISLIFPYMGGLKMGDKFLLSQFHEQRITSPININI